MWLIDSHAVHKYKNQYIKCLMEIKHPTHLHGGTYHSSLGQSTWVTSIKVYFTRKWCATGKGIANIRIYNKV